MKKFENEENIFYISTLCKRDVFGRICLKKRGFIAMKGYNEALVGYGFEDFDLPGGPGNAHRSIPSATPFLAFLNDDHSIDLEFYQSIGEVEIAISQNGNVVYSSAENIDSPIL